MREALCDISFSINVMTLSTLKKLFGLVEKHTYIVVGLADIFFVKPHGKVKGGISQVDRLKFQVYFLILEIEDEEETKLLLGRPFLASVKALIDVNIRDIAMWFNNEYTAYSICA